MKFQTFSLVTLTMLTLAACGGGGSSDGAVSAGTSPSSSSSSGTVAEPSTGGVDAPAATGPQEMPVQPTAADVADKYSGAWVLCFAQASASVKRTLVFTKATATMANYTLQDSSYSQTTCSGPPASAGAYSETGTINFMGTKVVGTSTVDKLSISVSTPSISTQSNIGLVSGNLLNLGNLTSAKDDKGYPAALDMTFSYVRR
jgi:hypothetical protein